MTKDQTKSQRSGRRNISDRIRELVSLIGSLSEQGKTVSLEAISARLGIPLHEAKRMVDIVCQASGQNTGGLLISCNDEETEFTLQYPGVHGRPIRLTMAETTALLHALDTAGVNEDDPLRQRVEDAFAHAGVDERTVKRSLGPRMQSSPLLVCAQSQAQDRAISFWYKGTRDAVPRKRTAVVRSLEPHESTWIARAYDLDIACERSFRVDRMDRIELGNTVVLPTYVDSKQQTVELVFYDETYLHCFSWPGIKVLRTEPGIIRARIPYYGDSTNWLIRRIAACNTKVVANDKRIMDAVREYAKALLSD